MAVLLALALAIVSAHSSAAPTRVTLSNASTQLTGLTTCLAARVGASGPVVPLAALADGLEFRLQLRAEAGGPALLVMQGLLKPDVVGLLESHPHDDDPEAQADAGKRFFHLLRIPVGTRAWVWWPESETALCGEAADWITRLRGRPILFDRLGPDGEPH
jgi:hypothetical protein